MQTQEDQDTTITRAEPAPAVGKVNNNNNKKKSRKPKAGGSGGGTAAEKKTEGKGKISWLDDEHINRSATVGDRRYASHMPAEPDRVRLPNGRKNTKYIDFIGDEPQTEIAGLEDRPYTLVAILSPEEHLRRQECFRLEKWVQKWPFLTLTKGLEDFVAFVAHKYSIKHSVLHADFEDFMTTRAETLLDMGAEVDYERFVNTFREQLDAEMEEKHGFKTQVRAFKILGAFKDDKAAGDWVRKNLNLNDPKTKTMPYFLGIMHAGTWTALSPEMMRGQTENTEYLQEQLNHLMKHAHANAAARQSEHERRVNEQKYKQYQKNVKLAAETGQKVTQVILPDGTTQRTLVKAGGEIVENLDDRTSAGTNVTSGTAPTLMSDLAESVEMHHNGVATKGVLLPSANF